MIYFYYFRLIVYVIIRWINFNLVGFDFVFWKVWEVISIYECGYMYIEKYKMNMSWKVIDIILNEKEN